MNLNNLCETAGFLRTILILRYAFNLICIAVPIIIIITIIFKLGKVVVSGKEDELKATLTASFKKVIAGLVIFLLPSILTFTFSLVEENFDELTICINNATPENVKYYETISEAITAVQSLEASPTKSNVTRAQNAVAKITSFAREDDVVDLLTRISRAEIKANENELIQACKAKNGHYENGYCTVVELEPNTRPEPNTGGNGNNGGNGSYNPSGSTGGMVDYNVSGTSFKVVNTSMSVNDYVKFIASRQIAQNKDTSRYSDKCLGFAYTHAWGLYTANTSYTAEDGLNYTGAGHFTTYINDSKQDVLSKVYNELINGHPVILQVNGNKAGTSRHFVTVVGFNSRVTSASNITEQDLLIIDSWDGRLERMDTSGSRFMTSGRDCGKRDYSGYRIQYLKG